MIINTPVFYRAAVVRPGHRKEEDCLIRLELPVRIDEAAPPLAISLEDNVGAWAAQSGAKPPQHAFMGPASWYDRDGMLMGEFRQVMPSPMLQTYGIERLQEDLARPMVHTRMNPKLGDAEASPLFSRAAMTVMPPGINPALDPSSLPVYDEGSTFRSLRPARDGLRDEAIAFARLASRNMLVHAETGELLVPSIGPVIMANTRPMGIAAHARVGYQDLSEAWNALGYDEALVRHRQIYDGLPLVPSKQTLTVLRPEVVTWDARQASITHMAARLGMNAAIWEGIGLSQTFFGLNRSQVSVAALSKVGDIIRDYQAHRPQFLDCRQPSDETVQVAHQIVARMHDLQHRLSCDFSNADSMSVIQPHAMRHLAYALRRAASLPCLRQQMEHDREALLEPLGMR